MKKISDGLTSTGKINIKLQILINTYLREKHINPGGILIIELPNFKESAAFCIGFRIKIDELHIDWPLGFIFISRTLIENLKEDECQFVVYHELGHIMNNHLILTALVVLCKQKLINWLAKKLKSSTKDAETLVGLIKILYSLLTKKRSIEEKITAQKELDADRFAVKCQHKKGPALSVFYKLSNGQLNAPSHFTIDGSFRLPAITYEERIKAIKSLPIIRRTILKRRFYAHK
jgi:Zn-dependent protease with chaperone function